MSRPDARTLHWSAMLAPTQNAVRDLIERLNMARITMYSDGKGKKSEDVFYPEMEFASSFLLLGARGSGKTTVLLSTRQAIEDSKEFFKEVNGRSPDGVQVEGLQKKAEQLKEFLTWLDLLDLGPLGPNSNILVHILVRIRDHFLSGTSEKQHRPLLGNDSDTLLSSLDRLIQRAAFLWGKGESDGDRKKSHHDQVTEAEHYLAFRNELQAALKSAVEQLAVRQRNGPGRAGAILVAINNIDRRSEHFAELVKLIPLLTGRHLWLILAASPMDLDVLAEKTSREEAGLGAAEFSSSLKSLGRRQHVAARRKAFPPAQEIMIGPIGCQEALNLNQAGSQGKTMTELLAGIEVLGLHLDRSQEAKGSLLELFDLQHWFAPQVLDLIKNIEKETAKKLGCPAEYIADKGDSPVLSEAGRHALSLPHRSLVDLWMRLDRLEQRGRMEQQNKGSHECAIEVAYKMLLEAIDDSEAEPEVREFLHRKLLVSDRHPVERSFINLTGQPIRRRFLRQQHCDIPVGSNGCDFEVEVAMTRLIGCSLSLELETSNRLATEVEGWFMILFDLIGMLSYSRIINNEPQQWNFNPRLVSTRLRGIPLEECLELQFHWPIPAWETFLDYEIFARQWQACEDWLEKKKLLGSDIDSDCQLRWLRAAYLDSIVSVSKRRGGWNWVGRIGSECDYSLEKYEKLVFKEVLDQRGPGSDWEHVSYDRIRAIDRWHREVLPFYFSSFFGFQENNEFASFKKGRVADEFAIRRLFGEALRHSEAVEALERGPGPTAVAEFAKKALKNLLDSYWGEADHVRT